MYAALQAIASVSTVTGEDASCNLHREGRESRGFLPLRVLYYKEIKYWIRACAEYQQIMGCNIWQPRVFPDGACHHTL